MRLAMIREVERKELNLFFSAPIGYLFLALFLAVVNLVAGVRLARASKVSLHAR